MMMGSRRAAVRDILVGICRKYEFSKKNKPFENFVVVGIGKTAIQTERRTPQDIWSAFRESRNSAEESSEIFVIVGIWRKSEFSRRRRRNRDFVFFDSWRNICSCNLLLLLKL
jgi:hypothetical protein